MVVVALEEVTGQSERPQLVVTLWLGPVLLALPLVAVALAVREIRRLRQSDLSRLLRGGDER